MRIKHQFKIRDCSQDCQREIQSSKVREIFQRIMVQTNNDSRFQILILTNSCTWSQFLTEAMLWIKEVELVDSVDDVMCSSSMRGIQMPNIEVLYAKIASALNRIIHNSHFERKISLEEQKAQKEDRFLWWKTDRLLDIRVLLCQWSQRFRRELCRPLHYSSK